MNAKPNWLLLARYLSGECSAQEKQEVQSWLASKPENERLLRFMEKVWNTPEIQDQPSDVDALWREVAKRTGIASNPVGQQELPALSRPAPKFKWPAVLRADSYLMRAAAAFLVMFTLGYLLRTALPWFQPTGLVTLVVENGKRETITLDDGTLVALDAGSTLRYPKKFGTAERKIYLDGEGYFEVARDEEMPFVVNANNAVVRVLGTKFNVRAWQPDETVTVAVAEGKVSLGAQQGTPQEAVIIVKGQVSELSADGRPSAPHPADIDKYLGWMQNEMTFEDAPLHDILFQLERWYDVQFVLPDSAIAEERLTVHFKDETIDDIMVLLSALTDLQYQRTGKSIRLWFEDLDEQ